MIAGIEKIHQPVQDSQPFVEFETPLAAGLRRALYSVTFVLGLLFIADAVIVARHLFSGGTL